jgi:hypothetical protein
MVSSRDVDECKLKSTWKITKSNPSANLDDSQFNVCIGFVVWATVVLAGVGTSIPKEDVWSRETEVKWKFAEFGFPLLAAIALGLAVQHNYMALMFLLAGGAVQAWFSRDLDTHMHVALCLT